MLALPCGLVEEYRRHLTFNGILQACWWLWHYLFIYLFGNMEISKFLIFFKKKFFEKEKKISNNFKQ
jgi:cytochrome b subunit of formate dehydrogenase